MDRHVPVRWADVPATVSTIPPSPIIITTINASTLITALLFIYNNLIQLYIPPVKPASTLDREIDQQFLTKVYSVESVLNKKVSFVRADITRLQSVEAIVNAARPSLLGGGGVDGAIHKAAGPGLLEVCKPLGGCLHGQAKITVGPNRDLHTFEESVPLLEKTYLACLDLMLANHIRSVAFPAISTGAYRFPSREAGHISLKTVRKWLEEHHEKVDLIVFCVFTSFDEAVYNELFPLYFPTGERTAN